MHQDSSEFHQQPETTEPYQGGVLVLKKGGGPLLLNASRWGVLLAVFCVYYLFIFDTGLGYSDRTDKDYNQGLL